MEADPYEWNSSTLLGTNLSKLEESLCCPICNDYYNNPHILNCGHSFCRGCILKHLNSFFNKTATCQKCPSCNADAELSHMKPNRSLISIVFNFQNSKPLLIGLVNCPKLSTNGNNKNENTFLQPNDTQTNKILSSSDSDNVVTKLPFKVFHKYPKHKIKQELINLCNACGSSVSVLTDGSAEDLERRYHELVILNNSQINSNQPLTFTECVQEINKREKVKLKMTTTSATITRANINIGFKKLIQQVSQKKNKSKSELNVDVSDNIDNNGKNNEDSNGNTPSLSANNIVCINQNPDYSRNEYSERENFNTNNCQDLSHWQVTWSDIASRPFFYNTETRIGQFAVPPEFTDFDSEYWHHSLRSLQQNTLTKCINQPLVTINNFNTEDKDNPVDNNIKNSDQSIIHNKTTSNIVINGTKDQLSQHLIVSPVIFINQQTTAPDDGINADTSYDNNNTDMMMGTSSGIGDSAVTFTKSGDTSSSQTQNNPYCKTKKRLFSGSSVDNSDSSQNQSLPPPKQLLSLIDFDRNTDSVNADQHTKTNDVTNKGRRRILSQSATETKSTVIKDDKAVNTETVQPISDELNNSVMSMASGWNDDCHDYNNHIFLNQLHNGNTASNNNMKESLHGTQKYTGDSASSSIGRGYSDDDNDLNECVDKNELDEKSLKVNCKAATLSVRNDVIHVDYELSQSLQGTQETNGDETAVKSVDNNKNMISLLKNKLSRGLVDSTAAVSTKPRNVRSRTVPAVLPVDITTTLQTVTLLSDNQPIDVDDDDVEIVVTNSAQSLTRENRHEKTTVHTINNNTEHSGPSYAATETALSTDSQSQSSSGWQCPQCTYTNRASDSQCEICDFHRQGVKRKYNIKDNMKTIANTNNGNFSVGSDAFTVLKSSSSKTNSAVSSSKSSKKSSASSTSNLRTQKK